MSYAGLDGEQDSNITSFAIYDGKTQKATQVGQIANTTASSGDAVFMDGRYFTLGMAVRMLAAPISTI